MIICPTCRHVEIAGALFCSECGANLIQPGGSEPPAVPAAEKPLAIICLVDSGETLPVFEKQEVILGRSSSGHATQPDIDLGPFGGYEAGVSRQHALIQFSPQVMVTDLGSANGTLLNGHFLSAHQPVPLHSTDLLSLGKLKIQVLFQK